MSRCAVGKYRKEEKCEKPASTGSLFCLEHRCTGTSKTTGKQCGSLAASGLAYCLNEAHRVDSFRSTNSLSSDSGILPVNRKLSDLAGIKEDVVSDSKDSESERTRLSDQLSNHRLATNSNEPVWKRPAWITAMVGLIGIFLTVPDIVTKFLSGQEAIRLAEEKTKALGIENIGLKQSQEFSIVNNTLAQQGPERVFVLRYLAATLDDDDAKNWAKAEVDRLDKVTEAQLALDKKEQELITLRKKSDSDSKGLQSEAERLQSSLAILSSELRKLGQEAGLGQFFDRDLNRPADEPPLTIIVDFDWSRDVSRGLALIKVDFEDGPSNLFHYCGREKNECSFSLSMSVFPDTVTIDYPEVFKSARAELSIQEGSVIDGVSGTSLITRKTYLKSVLLSCDESEGNIVCRRSGASKD